MWFSASTESDASFPDNGQQSRGDGVVFRMASRSRVVLLLLPLLILITAHVSGQDARESDGPHSDPVSPARITLLLSSAKELATRGEQELSFRAAILALQHGIPASSRRRSLRLANSDVDDPDMTDSSLSGQVLQLCERWDASGFSSDRICDTLQSIVLPAGNPGSVRLYADVSAQTAFLRSVASELIRRSVESGRTDTLTAVLEQRLNSDGDRLNAWHLLLLLSLESRNDVLLVRRLSTLSSEVANRGSDDDVFAAAVTTIQLCDRGCYGPACCSATELLLRVCIRRKIELSNDVFIPLLRQYSKAGDREGVLRCTAMIDSMSGIRGDFTSSGSLMTHHLSVAEFLFSLRQTDPAAERVRRMIDLEVSEEHPEARIPSRLISLLPLLHILSPQDQYSALRHCYLGERRTIPSASVLMLRGCSTPASASHKDCRSVWSHIVSSAGMLIDAAVDSGEAAALRAELEQRAHVPGVDHVLAMLDLRLRRFEQSQQFLIGLIEELSGPKDAADDRNRPDSQYLVPALVALEYPETRKLGLAVLHRLQESREMTEPVSATAVRSGLTLGLAAEYEAELISLQRKSHPLLWQSNHFLSNHSRFGSSDNVCDCGGTLMNPVIAWNGVLRIPGDGCGYHPFRSLLTTPVNRSGQSDAGELRAPRFSTEAETSLKFAAAGSASRTLYFPWPLSGEFEFTASSLTGSGLGGALGFDGIDHQIMHPDCSSMIRAPGPAPIVRRVAHRGRSGDYFFNTVAVSAEALKMFCNGHLVYSEDRSGSGSPWITLRTESGRNGIWRFPTLSGTPEILPSVPLSGDPRLRGWNAVSLPDDAWKRGIRSLDKSDPTAVGRQGADRQASNTPGWFCEDTTIIGRDVPGNPSTISLLQYDRPLHDGDSIAWEFEYREDVAGHIPHKAAASVGVLSVDLPRMECHPVVGRHAFLIRRDGVFVRTIPMSRADYIVSGESNLTELRPHGIRPGEETAAEKTVELREGWNTASLKLIGDEVELSVNESGPFRFSLTPECDRKFGLFHQRSRTRLRVRNLMLTGSWPRTLPPDLSALMTAAVAVSDPSGRSGNLPAMTPRGTQPPETLTASENRALSAIVGSSPFSASFSDLVLYVSDLTDEQAFQFLYSWVLPESNQIPLRNSFIPWSAVQRNMTESPPGRVSTSGDLSSKTDRFPSARSSRPMFIWSAWDILIDVAYRTDSISDLSRQIDERLMASESPLERFQLHSLATMIQLRSGNEVSAHPKKNHSDGSLAESASSSVVFHLRELTAIAKADMAARVKWSEADDLHIETLVSSSLDVLQAAARYPQLSAEISSLLDAVEQAVILSGRTSIGTQMLPSAKEWIRVTRAGSESGDLRILPASSWIPGRTTRADLLRNGLPPSYWIETADGILSQVSGDESDFLTSAFPVVGDFQFECSLIPVRGRHLRVGYGGVYLIPDRVGDAVLRIPFGRDPVSAGVAQFIPDRDLIWNLRMTRRAEIIRVEINDRLVVEESLSTAVAPWLCIAADRHPGAAVSNIRLTGNDRVPGSVSLDTGRDLVGWTQPFFGNGDVFRPHTRSASDWRSEETILTDPRRESLRGSLSESLLQYFRPLSEPCTLTFSFLYQSGSAEAHPALGDIAFLIRNGQHVSPHVIGQWPSARHRIPSLPARESARTSREYDAEELIRNVPVTLIERDWNTVSLKLSDTDLEIVVNNQPVYRAPLVRFTDRTFGVFHFNHETAAHCRGFEWSFSGETSGRAK